MESLGLIKIVRSFATIGNLAEVFLLALAVFFAVPTRDSLVIGGLILAVGAALHVTMMCSKKTFAKNTPLGAQRLLRHPVLASQIFCVLGVTVAARSSLVFAVALITLSLVYKRRFEIEDKTLRQNLGPAYDLYHHSVPAIFPDVFQFFQWKKSKERNFFPQEYLTQESIKLKIECLISLVAFFAIYIVKY